jgi:hypothetical protein
MSDVWEVSKANLRELRKAEVQRLRIHLPRTQLNKGKEKDRSVDAPVLLSIVRLLWELTTTTPG